MTDDSRPGWGWAIASAALIVGLAAFFFPLAPFWTLLWLVALAVVLQLTPLGTRWVVTQQSALLSEVGTHPLITRHPRLVASAVFVLPAVLAPGIAWDLSDPGQRWNGGALWAMAVFGFLVRTAVEELRRTGHPARWWSSWLALTLVIGGFVLVGGPARARWAHCDAAMTAAARADLDFSADATGRWCWGDAVVRTVDGGLRLYVEVDDSPEAPADSGTGLAYSPDGTIETAAGIRALVPIGDGWYWFETGSPVRSFWFDG
ncbi:MAG: hypothetical protein ACKO27_09420 [Ilumatobacteraceae bacterium]